MMRALANGSGRRQTWFEIDGGNGIDTWGRQTIFTRSPRDAVQEMTVLENAFSAEYGFGMGGDVNEGYAYYDALDVNLSHRFNNGPAMLASYTWSHAIDNVDPDVPSQNPNEPNLTGAAEKGNRWLQVSAELMF